MPRLHSRPEILQQRATWKREGKIVVFTHGCYDLLHPASECYTVDQGFPRPCPAV